MTAAHAFFNGALVLPYAPRRLVSGNLPSTYTVMLHLFRLRPSTMPRSYIHVIDWMESAKIAKPARKSA
jgi:hypothetical protein